MRTPPEGREKNSNGIKKSEKRKTVLRRFFLSSPAASCTKAARPKPHKHRNTISKDEACSLCVSTCSHALVVHGGPQLPCSGAHPCHCHPQCQAQGFYLDLFRLDLFIFVEAWLFID